MGMPTERTLTEGLDIFNSIGDVPGVTFGVHVCKGNNMSQWISSGGYDLTAQAMFSRVLPADQLRRLPAGIRRRALRLIRATGQGTR
jgi:5-methyltetrahydropteroyltriglutamate--homocysteine methyltransferase